MTTEQAALTLALNELRLDGGTQPRAALHEETVEEYTELLLADPAFDFPAATCFDDGTDYWLADGFHRHAAYTRARRERMPVSVRLGSHDDALLYALSANQGHGLRRTNADKRRAVRIALEHPVWREWSHNQIARICAVTPSIVARVAELLAESTSESSTAPSPSDAAPAPPPPDAVATASLSPPDAPPPVVPTDDKPPAAKKVRKYRTKHGKIATMDTSNIGQSQKKKKTPAASNGPTAGPAATNLLPSTDILGLPLPEVLKPVFAVTPLLERAARLHRDLVNVVNEIALAPGGVGLLPHLERHEHEGGVTYRSPRLAELKSQLKGAEPYAAVCPRCHRPSPTPAERRCDICQDRGWVSLAAWERCTAADREAVEALAEGERKKAGRRHKS